MSLARLALSSPRVLQTWQTLMAMLGCNDGNSCCYIPHDMSRRGRVELRITMLCVAARVFGPSCSQDGLIEFSEFVATCLPSARELFAVSLYLGRYSRYGWNQRDS